MNKSIIVWIVIAILGVSAIYVILVVLTDGRYFGKWLMNRIYDVVGPSVFSAQSEAERWQALVKNIGLRGNEKILDIGTAAGDLPLTIAAMSEFHGQVLGIDRSETMIAVARQKANKHGLQKKVKFEVVNVQTGLVYKKHEFDVIICLGLLETLPEAAKLLKDFTRVLKSNGVIVLSLYRGWAAASVALSYDWYEEHLTALGFREMGVFPCRRNQDVVIAHR